LRVLPINAAVSQGPDLLQGWEQLRLIEGWEARLTTVDDASNRVNDAWIRGRGADEASTELPAGIPLGSEPDRQAIQLIGRANGRIYRFIEFFITVTYACGDPTGPAHPEAPPEE
jgi:hypothetical protein